MTTGGKPVNRKEDIMGEANRMRGGGVQFKALKPGQQVPIDLKNAVKQVCHCGCGHFIPAVSLYKVSALVSPTGQELMAQQPVMVCLRCQTPLESLTNKGGEE